VILPDEQAAFASRLRDGSVKGWAYLYTERGHLTSDYVGWSFTQVLDGKRYPSYGVSPSYQGRGFGRWIVQHTLDATMGDAYGEAFLRNEAILHLDKSLGWLETGRHDSPHGEIVDLFRPYP
jgi:GNAT superfamily N-acetyltransferase